MWSEVIKTTQACVVFYVEGIPTKGVSMLKQYISKYGRFRLDWLYLLGAAKWPFFYVGWRAFWVKARYPLSESYGRMGLVTKASLIRSRKKGVHSVLGSLGLSLLLGFCSVVMWWTKDRKLLFSLMKLLIPLKTAWVKLTLGIFSVS